VLDSAGAGMLSVQGNARVVKLTGGKLAYEAGDLKTKDPSPIYNTVSTPKGGQYEVVLPDGTKVWLDAASSIRFPTAFTAGQRKVELTGEAYFEVVADAERPFVVSVVSQRKQGELQKVSVLGTRFNVMAYVDEDVVRTTLLDGEVEVASDEAAATRLRAGQQAQMATDDRARIDVVRDADVDAAVAWKNGYFDFNRADIHAVMRQLSRWYNIDVVYRGSGAGREFYGGMQRNLPLSAVCSILEKSGVEFSMEDRTLTVNL
jgi:ferric-dicitrate binding protein FerR (iron transport regulator)